MQLSSPYIPPINGGYAAPNYASLGTYGPNNYLNLLPDMGAQNSDLQGYQMPSAGITDVTGAGGGVGITAFRPPSLAVDAPSGGLFDNFFSKTDTKTGIKSDGWGGMALGAAGGLAQAYMGMKQYGLAKDQLAEGKRQYDQNYAAQRTTTNAALEDRQRARVASNPGAYQSVGDYMQKNGIR